MNIWNQASVVRLLVPLVAGILLGINLQVSIPYSFFILIALIIFLIVLSDYKNPRFQFRLRWPYGLLISCIFFLCGIQLTYLNSDLNNAHHFSRYLKQRNYLLAEINAPLVEKGKSLKTEMRLKAVWMDGKWQQCMGNAMLSLQKDSSSAALAYGDLILIDASLKEIPGPQNPSEFDYKRYLYYHNIHYQVYLKSASWTNLHFNDGSILMQKCLALRDYLLSVFKENGLRGNEFAVGAALILGYEDKLDQDIMSSYSASGALHVLSVSGLHLAIVFVVLNYLLLFLEKFKNGKLIKAALLVVMLWFYAALTGLSPSVLRSAAMFTLIIIGKSLERSTNIYNTLAASMLALLLWNPFLILDVGFQLSYLAVLGIVALQPGIAAMWDVKHKLLQHIWSITSVSIAAQLATFPLGLYYFHQFPNYFLISNLIVIPVSSVILYLGVAICGLAKIKILASVLCKALAFLLWFLNSSVQFFQNLPHAVIDGVTITKLESSLLYAVLFSFFLFLSFKKINFLKVGLVSLSVLLCTMIYEKYVQEAQRKLVVYNIKNHAAFDLVNGTENYFFSDSALLHDRGKLRYHVKSNWCDLGIERTAMNDQQVLDSIVGNNSFLISNHLIHFNRHKILFVNADNVKTVNALKTMETIDYIILSENSEIDLPHLNRNVRIRKLIFDSSNSSSKINVWKKQCMLNNIAYYDVKSEGAFVATL